MLFPVAEELAPGHDTHAKEIDPGGEHKAPGNLGGCAGSQGEGHYSIVDPDIRDQFLGKGIEELQPYLTLQQAVGEVGDLAADGGMITLPEEARHVGCHHQLLLRECECFSLSTPQLPVVCQQAETPAGVALRHGESDLCLPFPVGTQLRIEEGGLAEIAPHLRN